MRIKPRSTVRVTRHQPQQPALPALVKASRAQIATGIGWPAEPAASNEGSSLGNK